MFRLVLLACLCSLAPAVALAADKGPWKVAYVDLARSLNEVEDGKRAKARLKAGFDKKQKKLDELQTALKNDKDAFEKRKSMMKPDARKEKEESLQKRFVELQQTYYQLQKELIDEEAKITQEIGAKLRKVIDRLGDRDTYSVILNIGDTVLYHKRHLDITDEVVREYDKQFKAK